MPDPLMLLGFALLPALGYQLGAAAAIVHDPPRWLLGATLHAAAGIALAVASLELAPISFLTGPVAGTLIAFSLGGTFSVALNWVAQQARRVTGAHKKGALAVYTVAAADVFGDGLMTGAGGAVAVELAAVLGVSQLIANIPAGYAGAASYEDKGGRRGVGLALAAAMFAPALIAACVGWFALRGRSEEVQAIALSAVAGLLILATVEDLLPQADKPQSPRGISTGAFILGFIGMAAAARLF